MNVSRATRGVLFSLALATAAPAQTLPKTCKEPSVEAAAAEAKAVQQRIVDARKARSDNAAAIRAGIALANKRLDELELAEKKIDDLETAQKKDKLEAPKKPDFVVISQYDEAVAKHDAAQTARNDAKKAAEKARKEAEQAAQDAIDALGSPPQLNVGGTQSEDKFKDALIREQIEKDLRAAIFAKSGDAQSLAADYLIMVDRVVKAKGVEPSKGSKTSPIKSAPELRKTEEDQRNKAREFQEKCGAALSSKTNFELKNPDKKYEEVVTKPVTTSPDAPTSAVPGKPVAGPPVPAPKLPATGAAAKIASRQVDMAGVIGQGVSAAAGTAGAAAGTAAGAAGAAVSGGAKVATGTGGKPGEAGGSAGSGTNPQPKAAAGTTEYIVQKNDTLGKIAQALAKELGFDSKSLFTPGGLVDQLLSHIQGRAETNTRDLIFPGQKINITELKADLKARKG